MLSSLNNNIVPGAELKGRQENPASLGEDAESRFGASDLLEDRSYVTHYVLTRRGQLDNVIRKRMHCVCDPAAASSSSSRRPAGGCRFCDLSDTAVSLAESDIPINEAKDMLKDFVNSPQVQVGPGSILHDKLGTRKKFSAAQTSVALRKAKERRERSTSSSRSAKSESSRGSSSGSEGRRRKSRKTGASGKSSMAQLLERQIVQELSAAAGSRDGERESASEDASSAGRSGVLDVALAPQFARGDTSAIVQCLPPITRLFYTSVIRGRVATSLLRYSSCSTRTAAVCLAAQEGVLAFLPRLVSSALLLSGSVLVSKTSRMLSNLLPTRLQALASSTWLFKRVVICAPMVSWTLTLMSVVTAISSVIELVKPFFVPYMESLTVFVEPIAVSEPSDLDVRSVAASKEKVVRESEWVDVGVVESSVSVLRTVTKQSSEVVNIEVLNDITAIDRTRPGLSYSQFYKRLMADHAVACVVNEKRSVSGLGLLPTYVLAAKIWKQRYQQFDVERAVAGLPLE